MTAYDTILVKTRGRVRLITLNRPQALIGQIRTIAICLIGRMTYRGKALQTGAFKR